MATLLFNAIPSGTLGYYMSLTPTASSLPFSFGFGYSTAENCCLTIWNPHASYSLGDIVKYNNTCYTLVSALAGNKTRPDNTFHWSEYACQPTGTALMTFSGVSGKVYDNDENYIYSYNDSQLVIEGHIFDTYHAYNVNRLPVNFDCTRQGGTINTLFTSGLRAGNFVAKVWGRTGVCCP